MAVGRSSWMIRLRGPAMLAGVRGVVWVQTKHLRGQSRLDGIVFGHERKNQRVVMRLLLSLGQSRRQSRVGCLLISLLAIFQSSLSVAARLLGVGVFRLLSLDRGRRHSLL